ncbi:hypothetical protein ACFQQB_24710 [Nonomuraea rubra]|uniref:hypothetical protein n=1 Tax=Nonomuraea rubra TaxID=46180 RepID=UPI003615E863
MLVRLQDHPEPLEPLHDLDPERAHPRVHAVGAQLARGADHPVQVGGADAGEGVGDAQVGVLAEADDEHELVGGGVAVEVVAVVEVAVSGGHVPHDLGGLVDGVVVER